MLKNQEMYIDYLNKVQIELELTNISKELTNDLIVKLEEVELIIPVIGAFSAGKSSLINLFLGKNYLPVGITPETAIASELRYSENEYIEAIRDDNSSDKYGIEEMVHIKEKVSEYKYIKVFLNNEKLKEIAPLILVDMPSFDSPLDLHNKAILNYLNRGAYYIVLTSIEDGTITRSMSRQLLDIMEYQRDFSFFLSKANLRAKSEVNDVVREIEELIRNNFDLNKKVLPISKEGGDSLEKVLMSVNPENLFRELVLNDLRSNFFKNVESLNVYISSLKKDKKENEEIINQLKLGLEKIIQKKERMFQEVKDKYSDPSIEYIVTAIGKELTNSIDQLTDILISNGKEAFSYEITEIIRHALIVNVKEVMNQTGKDVIDRFASEMKFLTPTLKDITADNDWLQKFGKSTEMLIGLGKGMEQLLSNSEGRVGKALYKTVATVLAVTTSVVAPLLEIVLIFLPDIISLIFEGTQKKRQQEQVKNNILTSVIPNIKKNLRSKLPEIFGNQIQVIIDEVGTKFEEELQNKQNEISKAEAERESKIRDIELEVEKYNNTLQNITSLAEKCIF
ncbi:MAG: dynamin family protein [Candidatus Delongbacteria bacterium]|nr:dynamin family protein [Candidatus Delongbacteria bacterium]MBN2836912.1 dynamin family protein [Candidatus Delongbacteria bacterium]